jgi:hypothetical protein
MVTKFQNKQEMKYGSPLKVNLNNSAYERAFSLNKDDVCINVHNKVDAF